MTHRQDDLGQRLLGNRVWIALTAALAVLTLSACGNGAAADDASDDASILVFAAASLADVMVEAELAFESANPGVDVEVNLAGSATLRAQILEGAPADVVATANPAIMDELVDAGAVAPPTLVATNRLVIATAPGNPAAIDHLDDLADPSVFVGLCAAEVPCGALADLALATAGVEVEADTREPDVRTLLAKIETGELDAGLVYATDVMASTAGVTAIDLPARLQATSDYPISTLIRATDRGAADAFASFLTAIEGRRILADNGFGLP